jgi:hypothetical protein
MAHGERVTAQKASVADLISGNDQLSATTDKDLSKWKENLMRHQVEARLLGGEPSRTLEALILIINEEMERRAEENLEARFYHHLRARNG